MDALLATLEHYDNSSGLDPYYTNITIHGKHYDLQPPALSIESMSQNPGPRLGEFEQYADWQWLLQGNTLPYYTLNDTLLRFEQVQENATCIPSAYYERGFSFLILFVFFLLTVIFAGIVAALRYSIHCYSRADLLQVSMGQYRAVLDIAQELRASLGQQVENMPCAVIEKLVKDEDTVVALETSSLPASRGLRLPPPKVSSIGSTERLRTSDDDVLMFPTSKTTSRTAME